MGTIDFNDNNMADLEDWALFMDNTWWPVHRWAISSATSASGTNERTIHDH
jgi:hypothetical protein